MDKMAKKFIRLTFQLDLDEGLLCDQELLKKEFNNSVKDFMDWFIENETIWKLITLGHNTPILKDAEIIEVK